MFIRPKKQEIFIPLLLFLTRIKILLFKIVDWVEILLFLSVPNVQYCFDLNFNLMFVVS